MMSVTEKLSITLPRDMAEMIRGKVRAGTHASNSEVIREALRLMQEQEGLKAQKLLWLREKIDRSLADPQPSVDAEEVFTRLEERHRRRGEADV
ncbi:MAG: type II toxin-antitoxin system ParD family antitoxin [Geminicoccaceae bacterium]